MSQERYVTGPYRATKLWNDAVRSFHKGMPLSRHWRGLRQYDNCFTASEAIDWLQNHLKSNPNFGPKITRDQTLKLLRKFFKSGLLTEARGNKMYPDDLQDNRELLRFSNRSPLKALRTPRRSPLAPINTNVPQEDDFLYDNQCASPDFKSKKSFKFDKKDNCFTPYEIPATPSSLLETQRDNTTNEEKDQSYNSGIFSSFPSETEQDAWRQVLFDKLQYVSEQLTVVGDGSAPLVALQHINPTYVKCNCLSKPIPPSSQMKGLMQSDPPSWILTAMKSLANWPNSSEAICNIPNYPGVEMDIFKIVKDFFTDMVTPLIPYELYDPILRLYIGAEFLDVSYRSPSNTPHQEDSNEKPLSCGMAKSSINDSVENLMLDISLNIDENLIKSPCNVLPNTLVFSKDTQTASNAACSSLDSKNMIESMPQTLKFNRLKDYTNFKDSLLYNPLRDSNSMTVNLPLSSKSQSEERRTLKSLKNKSKIASGLSFQEGTSPCLVENLDKSAHSDTFKKLLKTEDLDNYSLPPNSCFETAFTSDSPRTRIIPQKSVDTIHFRNTCGRPKSIAVTSLLCASAPNSSTDIPKMFDNGAIFSNKLNKSISEKNFESESLSSSSKSCSFLSLKEEEPFHVSKGKLKFSGSKSSLASRVRDSIKRRKEKSDLHKSKSRMFKKNSHSHDALSSCAPGKAYTDSIRFRTRSGGYANPLLNTGISSSECSSIKSAYSDLVHLRSESGIGSSHPSSTPDLIDFQSSTLRSRTGSTPCLDEAYSWKRKGLSPVFSSTPESSRNCNSRCSSSLGLSRAYTPNGCLSHSLASCVSNSMYLSALSELSSSTNYATLPSNLHRLSKTTPPSVQSFKVESLKTPTLDTIDSSSIQESTFDNKGSEDVRVTPKNIAEVPCAESQITRDSEGTSNLSSQKAHSSSASELGDPWKDRTPYGRVPPYIQGGLWQHYRSSPSKRLIGRQKTVAVSSRTGSQTDACLPGLLTKAGKDACVEALQYVFLLLEPSRRKKLRLLLRMMHKASSNEKLQLQQGHSQTRALMVNSFARCILLSEREGDYHEVLVLRIITFLMDNHEVILCPPQHIPVLAYRRLTALRKEKAKGCNPDADALTYCRQVSPKTFDQQKLTGSQKFLAELLDQIITNSKMPQKDKRKKIHEFRTHYPEIYKRRFPDNVEVLPAQRPPGTRRQKLKGLRKITSIAAFGKVKSIRI